MGMVMHTMAPHGPYHHPFISIQIYWDPHEVTTVLPHDDPI